MNSKYVYLVLTYYKRRYQKKIILQKLEVGSGAIEE